MESVKWKIQRKGREKGGKEVEMSENETEKYPGCRGGGNGGNKQKIHKS